MSLAHAHYMPTDASVGCPPAAPIVSGMERNVGYLVVVTVCLSVLMAAGQTLIALATAAAPLVLALGLVICAVRLVWHYTNRDR